MTVGSISDLRRAAHQTFGVEFAVDVVRILAVIGIHLAADGTLQPMVIAFMAPHGVVFILMVGAIDGGLYLCAAGFTDAVGRNMPLLIKGSTAMDTRQPVIDVVMLPAVGIVRITNAVAFNALEHHAGLTAHAARSPILGVAHVGVVRMIVFRLAVGALTPASILIPVPGVIIPVVVSITFNAGGAASIAGASGTIQPVLPVVALLTTFCTDVPVVGVVILPGVLPIIHSMGCCMNCDIRSAAIRANAGSVRTHGMMATLVSYCVTVLAGQPVPLNVRAPVVPVPIVVGLAFNASRAALTASASLAVQPVNGIIPGRSTILTLDPVFSLVGLPVVPVPFVVDLTRNASFTAGTACTGRAVQIVSTDINLLLAFYANMPMVGAVMLPVIPTINEMSGLHCQAGFSAGITSTGILTGHPMGTIIDGFRAILTCLPMAIVILVPGFPVPFVFGLASDATGATVTAGTGLAIQPVDVGVDLITAGLADMPVVGAVMLPGFPRISMPNEIDNDILCAAIAAGVLRHCAALEVRTLVEDFTARASQGMMGVGVGPGASAPIVTSLANYIFTICTAHTASASLAVKTMRRLVDRIVAPETDGPMIGIIILISAIKSVSINAAVKDYARLPTLSTNAILSVAHVRVAPVIAVSLTVFTLTPALGFIPVPGFVIPRMPFFALNISFAAGDASSRLAIKFMRGMVNFFSTPFAVAPMSSLVMPPGAAVGMVINIIGFEAHIRLTAS